MSLAHIPVDQITAKDLDALILGKAVETRLVEFKRDTYGKTDRDYAEFLADISSLANTSGGDLFIGIEAKNGEATSIVPFEGNADAEKLRLENVARNALQPRLSDLAAHAVPVAGGHVLVLRTGRSYRGPHRVVRNGSNRFWARSSNGKFEPDVEQLRSLFLLGPQMTDRIRDFHRSRLQHIELYRVAPVAMQKPDRICLHIVPFSAIESGNPIDLARAMSEYYRFAPFGADRAHSSRINLDGLLATSDQTEEGVRAYVQAFRSGTVESVACGVIAEAKPDHNLSRRIYATKWSEFLVEQLERHARVLSDFGVAPPAAVIVTMLETYGVPFCWSTAHGYGVEIGPPLDRDPLTFSDLVVSAWPTSREESAEVLRPLLDEIANAGGRVRSPLFDKGGRYVAAVNRG